MEVILLVACFLVASTECDNNLTQSDEFMDEKKYILKKKYRPMYHISAPIGWLNDPNGFVYFKQHYHIFYQYHPYNGAWGSIHWGHVVSQDLINWSYYAPALVPKDHYDKHGCLAGSAVVHNNYLTIFYTGNLIVNNKTVQNQNVAISADGIVFQKYLYNPVIRIGPYGNMEFRNPKVWQHGPYWYMLLGAAGLDEPCLLVYTSQDLFNWTFNTTLLKSYGDLGFMWENPDFFELDGAHILILSVQGMQTESDRFKNVYQTGYIIGNFSYSTMLFENMEISTLTFNELDYGHDFYAAKTMLTDDGRRLLVAWLGMWTNQNEESKSGWASMLTLIRELKLSSQGKLLMTPIREVIGLRSEVLEDAWYSPGEVFCACTKAFELIVNSSTVMYDAALVFEWTGERHYVITYSAEHGDVLVNRGGVIRKAEWKPVDHIYWHIFVDYSSIEVYCGNGEVVFSSRIYPKNSLNIRIAGDTQLHITQYKLRRSIIYNKKQGT